MKVGYAFESSEENSTSSRQQSKNRQNSKKQQKRQPSWDKDETNNPPKLIDKSGKGKSKVANLPESGEVTKKEFEKLLNFAIMSSMWYLNSYAKAATHVKQRLLRKGFTETDLIITDVVENFENSFEDDTDDLNVDWEAKPDFSVSPQKSSSDKFDLFADDSESSKTSQKFRNVIDETIQHLIGIGMIDDAYYAQRQIENAIDQGKHPSQVIRAMRFDGIAEEDIQSAMAIVGFDEEEDEDTDLVNAAFDRAMRSGGWSNLTDNNKRRQKLFRALCSRGFGLSQVSEVIRERESEWKLDEE